MAKRFHDIYEELAPEYGYATREDTKEFDPESPNGKLMTRVCGIVTKEFQERIEGLENELLEQSRLLAMSAEREKDFNTWKEKAKSLLTADDLDPPANISTNWYMARHDLLK